MEEEEEEEKQQQQQLQACEMCKQALNAVYCLEGCGHGFCRDCLGLGVAKCLATLQPLHLATPAHALAGAQCPLLSCSLPLSRHDLRVVAGPSLVRFLDLYSLSLLHRHYLPPLLHRCPSCSSPLVTLPSVLSSFMFCSSCHLLACLNCGCLLTDAGASSSLSTTAPLCHPLEKQCYGIVRSLIKLSSSLHAHLHEELKLPRNGTWYSMVRSVMKWCSCSQAHKDRHLRDSKDSENAAPNPTIVEISSNTNSSSNPQPLFPEIAHQKDTHLLKVSWNIVSDLGHTISEQQAPEKSKQAADAEHTEMQMEQVLRELTILLTESDSKLPPPVEALFCSHEIPYTVLIGLLRNDCVQDLINHSNLYFQLLSFLSALSQHPELLPLLCCPKSGQLDCWTQKNRWETPGSLMAEFWNLYKQATIVLQFSGTNKPGLLEEIKITFERLQERIRAWEAKSYHVWQEDAAAFFFDVWTKKLPAKNVGQELKAKVRALCESEIKDHPSSNKHPENSIVLRILESFTPVQQDTNNYVPSSAEMQAYKLALHPLQFRQDSILDRHYFRNQVKVTKTASPLSHSRPILKEMALLSTSLPLEWESSIHVRVDDFRMDVLKALVIGPAGTPYQNGIFLFDLMLPHDYPNKPPSMRFLTTASGTVRFNPNLYDNGSVCLSLLGTWIGPSWQPSKSTILQLLVSVQSLVFVPDPYYNEPGYTKSTANIPRALEYMKKQRLNTLLHSILPALRQPEPTFKDVIRTHFKLKAQEIKLQCSTWKSDQSKFQAEIIRASEKIQCELDKLIAAES